MNIEPVVVLKAGRDRSLMRRHPWLFSGAIERVDGEPQPGDTVVIRSADGRFLARGAFSPHSQLRARAWTFDENEPVDEDLIAGRIAAAVARRRPLERVTDAHRLVFAEADGLPGLVVDRYGPVVVCEINSAGPERWRHAIARSLLELPGVESVVERADAPVRRKEGLEARVGLLAGIEPDPIVWITERGPDASITLGVEVASGHKTGCYLDQRTNRARVAAMAGGRDVLDVCCYTGGFSVAAALGGARSVVAVDSSGPALAMAAANADRNGVTVEWRRGDAWKELRRLHAQGLSFGLVVLDPPKLASNTREVQQATRAYKDLNLWAMRLLRPGGYW